MLMQIQARERISYNLANTLEYDFTEFYNEYFPRIYNYVCYRVSNYNDADDLTSMIFYKLFEKRGLYRPDKAPLFAWVFGIARNAVTDYYRRRGQNTYSPLETAEDLAAPGSGPEDIAEVNETKRQLYRALTSLKDRERDLIALKFWSGLNNREIAKVTGLSESNIGVILFRAMQHLRNIMKIQGVDIDD